MVIIEINSLAFAEVISLKTIHGWNGSSLLKNILTDLDIIAVVISITVANCKQQKL